jgi:hypothetical protein
MTPQRTSVVLGIPVDARRNEIDLFVDEYVKPGYAQHAPKQFFEERLTCCGSSLQTLYPGAACVPAIELNEVVSDLSELGIDIEYVIKTTRKGSGFCG